MTLQQLEYIVALDNYRHYVTAAERSHVSQPNLTMQVKKLEDELGIKIFDRNKKPLQPTAAGQKIIDRARQVLREVDQLKLMVSSEKETIEGEYRLGIIPTLAPYLLPLFLPTFIQKYPSAKFRIQEMQTEQIIDHLDKGLLDMGLLVTPLEMSAIREIPIFNEPFLLYLPESHPMIRRKQISTEDLDPKEILVLDEGHCFREQALAICSKRGDQHSLGFEYQSGSIEALKGLVKKGIGLTFVPELSVLNELDARHIRRFSTPEPVREVSIVVHRSFTRETLLTNLHQTIHAAVPDRFKKIKKFVRIEWR